MSEAVNSKQTITMPELTEAAKKLISQYKFAKQQALPKQGVATIHVDEFASTVAGFYERIRMIVDWKEEHLIRRTAITRKLKRRFLNADLGEGTSSEAIAEPLILELIRGGHLGNNEVEEKKIKDVQKILDKYIYILKNCPQPKSSREKMQFYNWIIEIASCEIEENLASFREETALIRFMFETMNDRISLNERAKEKWKISSEQKNLLTYIAVQQSLFKLDNPLISYNLLKYQYPQWQNPDERFLAGVTAKIFKVWNDIEAKLTHPLGKKFYAICEKYDTPYLLLGDVLSKNPTENISEPQVLEEGVKTAYKERLSTLGGRLNRAALYSTLSVLLTNSLSVFLIEIPIARWFYGGFSSSPLLTISVDILGPTIIMFFMVASIKKPPKDNCNVVILETMKIAYKCEKTDIYEIKTSRKKGPITAAIVSFIYVVAAVVIFGSIFYILELARFPITSVIINVAFVAVISFTGMAIREKGQELTVKQGKEGVGSFLFDIFSLPVAGVGRWLSNKWKKYNAITAFFNAMIDMPFTVFVEFLEQWRYFIKEKKEEIR